MCVFGRIHDALDRHDPEFVVSHLRNESRLKSTASASCSALLTNLWINKYPSVIPWHQDTC